MPRPDISVVMTFFNEPPYKLARSVGSILAQTFSDFEFLIVPGNPANTETIREVEAMARTDPRVILLPVSEPLPMTDCLNLAIRKARAPYVALQESDDASRPGRLAAQFSHMESHPEVDVLGTALAYIDEQTGREIIRRSYPPGTDAFRRYAAIAHPTVFVRREVYDRCGFYDESGDWRHCSDYELWMRWLMQGVRFHTIPDLLFDYYQSEENGRNRNVHSTLRSVVRLKGIYRDRIGFTAGDRAFLALEKVLLLFPGRWIGRLFYVWVRMSTPTIR